MASQPAAIMVVPAFGLPECPKSRDFDWRDMHCKANDWIEHNAFGLGRVNADRGDRLDIEFINFGAKTILKTIQLKPAMSPPGFQFPEEKSKSRRPSQFKVERLQRRSPVDFDHLVECFIPFFDGGFDAEEFEERERKYKADAATVLKNKLSKDAFADLLRDGQYAEACEHCKARFAKHQSRFPDREGQIR